MKRINDGYMSFRREWDESVARICSQAGHLAGDSPEKCSGVWGGLGRDTRGRKIVLEPNVRSGGQCAHCSKRV